MDKQSIYLISFVVVFILFVIFLIILLKKKRVINLQKQVQELERQRNLIVSTPIASELAKIEVIVKNEKLESKYEEWKERYRVIKENRFQVITDMLLEIDGLIDANDIKNAKQKIMELEMEIYKLRVSTDNLLDEIREVTMSEERNRAIVTKLKSKFRDLERTFTTNQASYGDIDKYIELQFENIEKRFQEFETIMENNNYSEIVSSVKVLDEMIAHISTVIEEVPDLLLLTNKIIPSRIEEIKETYKTLLSKNYPLSYLNVDYNIEQIEKKVREDRSLDDIKVSDEMEKELFNKIQDYEYDKRHKKVVRKKKKSKLVIGALAAVLILVCGSVMTSVGSKSYWKTLWNDSNGDEQNNGIDVENMESIETEDIDESAVYKEIAKVMGNYLVRLEYKPKGMLLKRYTVDGDQRRVTFFYKYENEIIRYAMYMNSKDSSLGQKAVDKLLDEYIVMNGENEISVKEYEVKDQKEKRYIAEFEDKGIQYQLKGVMEKEEFEKILKNLFFV